MSQSLIPQNRAELANIWTRLNTSQKIGLGALVTAALTALIFFITWAQTPDYVAAYTDLTAEDGAAIITYLKENKIPYQVDGNGSIIRVPANQVNEIRLTLAGQGLPGKGTVGFELFDTANLGMTDFTQQVNYQRALEGELARTIDSLTAVKSTRVHIVIPQETLFSTDQNPTTASVVVDLESGQALSKEQALAISHLISSAVEGLTPENITIVDVSGNILSGGYDSSGAVALSATQIETKRNLEKDLELRIGTMLDNVLGPDQAVVRVALDLNWDQTETQSETYLPAEEGSVIRSSRQIVESTTGDTTTTGGVPGTGSNIPDAAPSYQTSISGTNGSSYQHQDITTNYEVSRSTSKVVAATGQINRMSVSVLVNNITNTMVISAIQQATIAAAGLNTLRGDVLTVNSIPFDRSFLTAQEEAMQATQQQEFYLMLARWGVVGLALIAMFFVVRGMQRSLRLRHVEVLPDGRMIPIGSGGSSSAAGTLAAAKDARTSLLEQISEAQAQAEFDPNYMGLGQIGPPKFDAEQQEAAAKAQMVRQLQLVAKNKPETLAQVIQFWITEG